MQLLKADYDYCTFDAKKLSLLRLGIFFFCFFLFGFKFRSIVQDAYHNYDLK